MHLTRGIENQVRHERQRRKRRPSGERTVVRPIGDTACGIAEKASRQAGPFGKFVARPVTCGESPATLIITGEFVWVALGVFALDERRSTAVLEIVAPLLAHEAVSDS